MAYRFMQLEAIFLTCALFSYSLLQSNLLLTFLDKTKNTTMLSSPWCQKWRPITASGHAVTTQSQMALLRMTFTHDATTKDPP